MSLKRIQTCEWVSDINEPKIHAEDFTLRLIIESLIKHDAEVVTVRCSTLFGFIRRSSFTILFGRALSLVSL